jgi:hypothetical protein
LELGQLATALVRSAYSTYEGSGTLKDNGSSMCAGIQRGVQLKPEDGDTGLSVAKDLCRQAAESISPLLSDLTSATLSGNCSGDYCWKITVSKMNSPVTRTPNDLVNER